ncbi:MAG: YraN family protein [Vicingaceae bacterium]|nr:YraN family protein [Vicingaceae bacterium]
MAQHNELGKQGEEKALIFLLKQGYKIVATNWHEHKFEIDIIALNNNEIVFVEVKTRATDFFGSPEEAVTTAKQQHLINGANYYLEQNEIDLNARFDVIAIVLNKNKVVINHIKDAFNAF